MYSLRPDHYGPSERAQGWEWSILDNNGWVRLWGTFQWPFTLDRHILNLLAHSEKFIHMSFPQTLSPSSDFISFRSCLPTQISRNLGRRWPQAISLSRQSRQREDAWNSIVRRFLVFTIFLGYTWVRRCSGYLLMCNKLSQRAVLND